MCRPEFFRQRDAHRIANYTQAQTFDKELFRDSQRLTIVGLVCNEKRIAELSYTAYDHPQ